MYHLQSRSLLPADVPLTPGRHELARQPAGGYRLQACDGDVLPSGAVTDPVLGWDVGERGVWMRVVSQAARVHLNGRPIARLAFVRPGDIIHVNGESFQLLGRHAAGLSQSALATSVLRVHGGPWHGRALPLESGLSLQMTDGHPVIGPVDAGTATVLRIRPEGNALKLEMSVFMGGILLNGESVSAAELSPGDQIDLGQGTRLIVESARVAPFPAPAPEQVRMPQEAPADDQERPASMRALPWLLLAALVSAGLLTGLLLFGTR